MSAKTCYSELEEDEEEEDDFNFDDFLKNGGVDLEHLEEEEQRKEAEERKKHLEQNRRKTRKAAPREDMEGPLYKTSVDIEQRNLLGGLFSTVKNSLG